jgi:hypothetical protein
VVEQVLLILVLHQAREVLLVAAQDHPLIVVEVQQLRAVVIPARAEVLHLLMELLVPLLLHGVIHRLLPVVVHVVAILPVAVVLPDLLVGVAALPVVAEDRKSGV